MDGINLAQMVSCAATWTHTQWLSSFVVVPMTFSAVAQRLCGDANDCQRHSMQWLSSFVVVPITANDIQCSG
jgi:hypothetical protein